jgi:hypothetical protein
MTEAQRKEVTLDDVHVMYLKSDGGVTGAKETFDTLERKLTSLRGRKFYGTYDPGTGEYRACVAMQPGDDPSRLGLQTWAIPGGMYLREKMTDWTTRVQDIGKTFVAMAEQAGNRHDESRPSVEFYRSESELILLLPVRAKESGSLKGVSPDKR